MKAYISCPLNEPLSKIEHVTHLLKTMGADVSFFIRGNSYKDISVRECDYFVLIPSNNKFDFKLEEMTAGCKSELELAFHLKKPLYLAYYKQTEGYV